ncbi:MAG: hypothetical protein AAF633_06260 [Chloroflexota bacterium]
MILFDIAAAMAGTFLVIFTVSSAIRTFVLPRGVPDRLTRFVYVISRRLFNLRLRKVKSYIIRDRVLAYYAPVTLVTFPLVWLTLVTIGFSIIFVGVGDYTFFEAYRLSGSAITTLGFATADGYVEHALVFTEAAMGLVLVAILISYLPTMYSAFSSREKIVTKLDVRAGSPPSAIELIKRSYRIGLDHELTDFWIEWENWFVQIEESHTSLPSLVFYRSPVPEYNWVVAAGVILDSAALLNSAVDDGGDPHADLCIRAGYLALRRISSFFGVTYNEAPTFEDTISISREEFEAACDELFASGIPIIEDRDQAWQDFRGWRVNYDSVLLAMCNIVMAPYAPWSSDRAHLYTESVPIPIFYENR